MSPLQGLMDWCIFNNINPIIMSPLQGFLDGCVFYNVALSGLVDQTGHPWNCIVPFTLDVLAHNNNVVPIMTPFQ